MAKSKFEQTAQILLLVNTILGLLGSAKQIAKVARQVDSEGPLAQLADGDFPLTVSKRTDSSGKMPLIRG